MREASIHSRRSGERGISAKSIRKVTEVGVKEPQSILAFGHVIIDKNSRARFGSSGDKTHFYLCKISDLLRILGIHFFLRRRMGVVRIQQSQQHMVSFFLSFSEGVSNIPNSFVQ